MPRIRSPVLHLARCVVFAIAIGAFVPALAYADAGAGRGTEATGIVVGLIVLVGIAYFLARAAVNALQKAFLVLAGVEYIVLGVLLGPEVPLGIPAFDSLESGGHGLMVVIALAIGWVGLLRGMELAIPKLRAAGPSGVGRVVLMQALIAGGATAVATQIVFTRGWFFTFADPPIGASAGSTEVWMAAGVMGCAAAAGSIEPIALLEHRYRLEGELAERIRRMAASSDLLAILAFGLLFCVFHEVKESAPIALRPTEWAMVSVALGGLLGLLLGPFLVESDSENTRFLALVGIIVIASGTAYLLDLSPLLVSLCLGVVLVNTAKSGPSVQQTLESAKRPMAWVLLIFAGALLKPVDPIAATAVTLGYIALRFAGKALGTYLAAWRTPLRGDYFRGLLAHGEVSVAMAVSLRLVYEGPAIDLAYCAIVGSVVVNDLIAPRVLRGLLVDTGDLRGERNAEPV